MSDRKPKPKLRVAGPAVPRVSRAKSAAEARPVGIAKSATAKSAIAKSATAKSTAARSTATKSTATKSTAAEGAATREPRAKPTAARRIKSAAGPVATKTAAQGAARLTREAAAELSIDAPNVAAKVKRKSAAAAAPAPRLSKKPQKARFSVGDVVRHRFYPFRGVIFDIDPVFNNTEEWWLAIPEKIRPSKDQPFYHLLAENAETEYVAYVSEQNLLPDNTGRPLRHPKIRELFEVDDDGTYRAVYFNRH